MLFIVVCFFFLITKRLLIYPPKISVFRDNHSNYLERGLRQWEPGNLEENKYIQRERTVFYNDKELYYFQVLDFAKDWVKNLKIIQFFLSEYSWRKSPQSTTWDNIYQKYPKCYK